MSNSRTVEMDRVLRGTEAESGSSLASFVNYLKKFLLVAFVAAVAFWALVLPFFSESLIKAVTK